MAGLFEREREGESPRTISSLSAEKKPCFFSIYRGKIEGGEKKQWRIRVTGNEGEEEEEVIIFFFGSVRDSLGEFVERNKFFSWEK